ncbi:MAG: sulfatase-modifying factor protein, partial [Bacteroidetes bacterium]
GRALPEETGWGTGPHPIVNVSWYDAVAFCNWLSRTTGLTPVYTIEGEVVTADWQANGYRLPTEAEWEFAARAVDGIGGQKVRFGNGKDTASATTMNFDSESHYNRAYVRRGPMRGQTVPVGTFAPNSLGLYDLSGNVREWCWDWFDAYTSQNRDIDPRGPEKGDFRVIRGGSWRSYGYSLRSSNRDNNNPNDRDKDIGFRLARSGP